MTWNRGGRGDMREPGLSIPQATAAIAVVWAITAVAVGLITGRITVGRTGSTRSWLSWPWLHWCMFDRDCRTWDCPPRLYIHALHIFVEFGVTEAPILCCAGRWGIVCALDKANHDLLASRLRPLCDWHERIITDGR